MRWFTYYERKRHRDVHLNLSAVLWWAIESMDYDDDHGPIVVTFMTVDGNEWRHEMSDRDFARLDRYVLAFERDPDDPQAVS